MKIDFPHIINTQQGKTGFVLGLGPSLARHLPLLQTLHNNKAQYQLVSCNNIDVMTELNFDYWLLAQPADKENPFCISNAYERYNARKNTTFIYTDCLDRTPPDIVERLLTCNYIGYDQRHFKSEPCGWGPLPGGRAWCCAGLIPGRLCIQEELQLYTRSEYTYGCGDTVGVHMLAVAIMLGLNPIYITGVDLDYRQGYVNNNVPTATERIKWGMSSINHNDKQRNRIIEDFTTIKQMAEKIGVQIYCMDDDLLLSKVFECKKFEEGSTKLQE